MIYKLYTLYFDFSYISHFQHIKYEVLLFQWIMSNIYPSIASIKSLNYKNIRRLNKQMNTYGNSTEG